MRTLVSIFILFVLFFFPFTSSSQTLKLVVEKIKEDKGQILISIFNREKGFPYLSGGSIKTYSLAPASGKVLLEVNDIHTGVYAIAFFQDIDGNKKITTNKVGIPKEGYGFSNNAMGMFGPPSFKDASFRFSRDTTIVVRMKYF